VYRPAQNQFLLHYVGQADASDLTDYALFDFSVRVPGGGYTKTQLDYLRIQACEGLFALLEWDATTDDLIAASAGSTPYVFPPPFDRADLVAGSMLIDPASTGTTGDIVLTTLGGAVGRAVMIDARIILL